MSDGDNATPGQHRAPDGDNQWLTRTPRPMPGAAPWERAANDDSALDTGADEAHDPGTRRRGSRADGVSVADLFARVTGDIPRVLQHGPDDTDPDSPEPETVFDPPTTPIQSAYAAEIPDLGAARPARGDARALHDSVDSEVDFPDTGPDRVAPAQLGPRKAARKARRAPQKGAVGRTKRHKSVLFAGRSIAALFAVLALVLTGGAWQWTTSKNNRLNSIAALDLNSRDILDPNAQFGDENFLIVGTDSRYGENSGMGAGNTEDADGSRSDSIILVNIPASRERVVAVSFPRDLAITPIECEVWNAATGEYGPIYDEETGTYGPEEIYTETKLNSAYSFGGPKCLVKAIQKMSGLSINRFMAVDFVGFSKMVDALGGVEVCSTTPLEDYELGTVLPHAGRQTIDGATALNYVRARQVTTEVNGDYGRIKRQQLFLSSLLRSLISKETFFSLSKLNNVVNMFINDSSVDNVSTKDLVDLGQSLQGVSAGRITFITVPTTGYADEWGNEQPRTDDIRALFDAIINDDPLPGENDKNETTTPATAAASSESSTSETSETTSQSSTETAAAASQEPTETTELVNAVTTDPDEVTVHVANSTSHMGLGAAASEQLELHGFQVDTPDDHSEALSATTVQYSPGNEQAAVTVAAAFGHPTIERVTGLGQEVNVILGADYASVGTPLPSGSPVSVTVSHEVNSTPTHLPEDLTVTNGADVSCE